MKHKWAVGLRVLMVLIVISFARPTIYSANGPSSEVTPEINKAHVSLATAALTSASELIEAVPHVPERIGLVLVGVALLGSAALLRRKWKVVRPS
jgi:hypothetical protein